MHNSATQLKCPQSLKPLKPWQKTTTGTGFLLRGTWISKLILRPSLLSITKDSALNFFTQQRYWKHQENKKAVLIFES